MSGPRTDAALFADIGLRVEDFGGNGDCGPFVGAAILWKRLPAGAGAAASGSTVRRDVVAELRQNWGHYFASMTDDERVSVARPLVFIGTSICSH
jgi:hypothetical protein